MVMAPAFSTLRIRSWVSPQIPQVESKYKGALNRSQLSKYTISIPSLEGFSLHFQVSSLVIYNSDYEYKMLPAVGYVMQYAIYAKSK